MESGKEVLQLMKDLQKIITDARVFTKRFVLRDGFPFTSVTFPANVYDALIIKPFGTECFSPKFPMYNHSIDDYVEFVNKHKLEKAIIIADNIDFIENCPTLKYLMVVPSDGVGDGFDFSPISKLPQVWYLSCATQYGRNFKHHSSIDYSQIKEIMHLNIAGEGHLNVNCVSTLKSLSIFESKAQNLIEVFNSRELDSLQIVKGRLQSLDGIEQSSKLQYIDLSYNRILSNISALEKVKNTLKTLIVKNCPNISDFSVIEKLENLEFLALYGKNSIPDLKFLNKLKKLRSFGFDMEVINGDLTPCLNLARAYCGKNKKHYNLSNNDLPKENIAFDVSYSEIDHWRRF